MKRFVIEYYGGGGMIRKFYVHAKNKADALARLHATGAIVLEIICVRNLDFPD